MANRTAKPTLGPAWFWRFEITQVAACREVLLGKQDLQIRTQRLTGRMRKNGGAAVSPRCRDDT
jgi:hypothetical protein